MQEVLNATAVKTMMEQVARHVIDNADLLGEADRATGDGDHGIGMRRGFEGALDVLASLKPTSVDEVMKSVGMAVLSKTGGAAGAVFGTLFRAGGKPLEGREAMDAAGFGLFLDAALEGVMKRGGVSPGQKTMIDALAPAASAVKALPGATLPAAMRAAADAASQGVEATKGMIATTGKARSLGERSLGHVDPGAVSVSLILNAMRDYVLNN